MVTGYECEPPIDPSLDVVNVVDKPSPQSMVTVHGASWSGSLKPAPLSENNAPTSTVWSPPAVTTGGWLGGGGAVTVTGCDTEPVALWLSVTVGVTVKRPLGADVCEVYRAAPQSTAPVHGASWAGSLTRAPLGEKNAPASWVWPEPAVTTGGWLGGGGAVTVTGCDTLPVALWLSV